MPTGVFNEGFSGPNVLAPVASVYRMFSKVGLPQGHAPHYHPETVEVCFILRGRLDWWIGDAIYELHAGDVVVMPVGMPHGSADSTLQPCEYYAVHLKPSEFGQDLARSINDPGLRGVHVGQPNYGQWVMQIYREHEQPDAWSAETCHALCTLLVSSLVRHKAAASQRRVSDLVHRAQEILVSAIETDTPVSEAARQLSVSTAWLTRKFHEELGEAPGEWLRRKRILEAKKLLAFERSGPTEVAVRLGFKSSQYFATAFKREIGVSPSAYRNLFWSSPGRRRFTEPVRADV